MKTFVRLSDRLVSYEGMSQETIIAMLAEQNIAPEFIDEEIYISELVLKNIEIKKT